MQISEGFMRYWFQSIILFVWSTFLVQSSSKYTYVVLQVVHRLKKKYRKLYNFHSFHLLRGLECCSVTSIKGGVWWMTRCESTLEGASSMMLSFAFRILSHLIFWLDLFWFLLIVVYVVNWQFYALFFCIIFHVLLCMSHSLHYYVLI